MLIEITHAYGTKDALKLKKRNDDHKYRPTDSGVNYTEFNLHLPKIMHAIEISTYGKFNKPQLIFS